MNNFSAVLKQADIFYGFTPTQIEMVANLCQEYTYNKGEVIFREGTNSDDLYIIARGEVEVVVTPVINGAKEVGSAPETVLTTLQRGQSFGEIALVDQGLRSATIRASQPKTVLLGIPREKLMQLCETYPQLGYRLMKNLALDLALKMRSAGLRFREEIAYAGRGK